jgi:SAM-dependent methyltransferase
MRVRPALQHATRVLDWGCRHAAMSRLLRADRGDAVDLHGCDVVPPDQYRAFHAAAALQYRRIDHPWRLAYDDGAFDAVIAAGTLEHVPNDGESMTQLWRVLAPGGVLVLTHLPNAWSWSEWMSRRWFPSQAHARRYRLARIRERLLSRGFVVEQAGYHQLMPSGLPASLLRHSPLRRLVDAIQPLNAFERVWPVRALSATMWLVARKHESF